MFPDYSPTQSVYFGRLSFPLLFHHNIFYFAFCDEFIILLENLRVINKINGDLSHFAVMTKIRGIENK